MADTSVSLSGLMTTPFFPFFVDLFPELRMEVASNLAWRDQASLMRTGKVGQAAVLACYRTTSNPFHLPVNINELRLEIGFYIPRLHLTRQFHDWLFALRSLYPAFALLPFSWGTVLKSKIRGVDSTSKIIEFKFPANVRLYSRLLHPMQAPPHLILQMFVGTVSSSSSHYYELIVRPLTAEERDTLKTSRRLKSRLIALYKGPPCLAMFAFPSPSFSAASPFFPFDDALRRLLRASANWVLCQD